MPSELESPSRPYLQSLKQTGVRCYSSLRRLFVMLILTPALKCMSLGKIFCINIAIPCLYSGTRLLRHEFIRIHEKQSWFHRCGATMAGNSLGLGMAMLSTRIVEHFVEVRDMSNLWGLLASRPVVSETTYEVFSFGVEFVIALLVFTLTEHYYEEFMKRWQIKNAALSPEE